MNPMIDQLCQFSREHGASDIFLHEGRQPQIKVQGEIIAVDGDVISRDVLDQFLMSCGGKSDETLDLDSSYVSELGGRFRVNFFKALGKRGAVLRVIKEEVPDFSVLGLPADILANWCGKASGLVLVCGPTGSGKSSTLAACLQHINECYTRHVVTIEDPIEFCFQDHKSLFTQREVGLDTDSFLEGLRRAMRQSPHVILLGEIRDAASAKTVLQACETGHLVLATLHASNTVEALERYVQFFGNEERERVLSILAAQLIGILSQKLLKGTSGEQVLALEHFNNAALTRKWIREGKFMEIADFLSKEGGGENQRFLNHLVQLAKSGLLSEEVAAIASGNAQEFQRALKGIRN